MRSESGDMGKEAVLTRPGSFAQFFCLKNVWGADQRNTRGRSGNLVRDIRQSRAGCLKIVCEIKEDVRVKIDM